MVQAGIATRAVRKEEVDALAAKHQAGRTHVPVHHPVHYLYALTYLLGWTQSARHAYHARGGAGRTPYALVPQDARPIPLHYRHIYRHIYRYIT